MIQRFVDAWLKHEDVTRQRFAAQHPDSYKDVVLAVVDVINRSARAYEKLDPERVHEIDEGHYQGTLVYVIAQEGYQPARYWGVTVGYGSCSGCDTLQAVRGYTDDAPTTDQVQQYMQLGLDVVRGLVALHGMDE